MLKQPVRGNLSDFIRGNMGSQFVIPVYQRNYYWNPEKETARFLQDLDYLLQNKEESHFMGIITYTENHVGSLSRQLQIVDGQQRLTTAFIFLLALKKAAQEKGQKACAGLIDDYYLYNSYASEDMRLRLKPSVSSDDVYVKLVYDHVIGLTQKEKESFVYRNYDYILKWIRSKMDHYTGMEILDTLARVDVLQFPLSDNDQPQAIFETINATGLPLTSADLIRNYILMNYPNDIQERLYQMYWKPLEEIFPDSRKLEDFFRYYLACKTFNLYSKKDVYEAFKQYAKQKTDHELLLKECDRYAVYYMEIYQGPFENKNVESALKDFRITSLRVPAPFLMEMHGMFRNKEISEKSYIQIIRLIDSYLTRRQLCGIDNTSLARFFAIQLRSVLRSYRLTHQDVYDLVQMNIVEYSKGKVVEMPTDEQVRNCLRDQNAYSIPVTRAVLERIEQYQSSAVVDLSALNIEHIMPRTPNEYWKKHSGVEDENEYNYYVNLIGNLTLCAQSDNVKMGNEDFVYKKKVLGQTKHIRLNTEILKKKEWNKNEILKRCDILTNQILEIYPYFAKEKEIISVEEDIVTLSTPTANARAIYHQANDIEVLPGTTLKAYGQREMQKMKSLFEDYVARGLIQEDSNGQAHFEQSVHFASLNDAAQFLLHRGGDNANAWSFDDGRKIKENTKKESKSKVNTKSNISRVEHDHKEKKKQGSRNNTKKTVTTKNTNRKSQKRNAKAVVPQKDHARNEKQPQNIVRFAGQDS